MCQAKHLGGKRCLRHHAGTKATVSYITAKTGVDNDRVYAILKELNKEGRKFEPPSEKEVAEYFDFEEFKTKYDTELEDKEKEKILKELIKARIEAQDKGVTGGAFHAWKNAFKETMKRFAKPIAAVGIIGALSFGLVACGSGTVKNEDVVPPGADSKPAAVSTCVWESRGAEEKFGDMTLGEPVTDERGEYCSIELKEDASIKNVDWETVEGWKEVQDAGISKEEVEEAYDEALTVVSKDMIDSPYFDSGEGGKNGVNWAQDNASRLSEDFGDPSTAPRYTVMSELPNSLRDGGPRVVEFSSELFKVSVGESKITGEKIPTFHFNGKLEYRVDKENYNKYWDWAESNGSNPRPNIGEIAESENFTTSVPMGYTYVVGVNKAGKISGIGFNYALGY